jgi:hypothetical protein
MIGVDDHSEDARKPWFRPRLNLRTCLVMSALSHVALLLWIVFATDAKPFDPGLAEPIFVDLISPQEVSRLAEPEAPQSELPKPELPKPALPKPEPPKFEFPKSVLPTAPRPAPKGNSKAAATDNVDDQAATAARLAWMLDLPTSSSASLGGPPGEKKSSLSNDEIAEFKARVSKCFVPPSGIANAPGLEVLMRIALKPNGALAVEPELVRAPASVDGPPLVGSAKQALRQCQPYDFLPADRYKDWKVLDVSFTVDGPSDPAGQTARKSSP